MKKMLFWLDLSFCSVWILNILCGHNYWNQANMVFIALIVLVRLTISFALARNEKKTWIPLLFNAALWGFYTTMNCFNGIGGAGEYFFHITGLEYNWFIEHCITGGLWMWIIVLPTIYYTVQFFRHKLVDTSVSKKELCGAILWKDRQARFYCAMMAISFFSFLAGTYMEQRLCQAMCFVSPALLYWVVCRYYKEDADKLWLIIVGSICFWYAQICGGVFRVLILAVSFALIAYTCSLLYTKTKQHLLTFCAIMYIGVILPSFSIGYNQYACINYPRRGYYHLAPYSGIIYISDDFNGTHMGLRDRYGLLVKPEYESIRPGKSRWGMPSTYYLEKDGYEVLYNINDNVIYPSDNNPELQKELCGIINTHFENRDTEYQDRGEIIITDLRDNKVVGKVRRNRYSDFVSDDRQFLPDDTAEIKCGQFLRTDSVNIIGNQYVNMLSYAENIPNDSVSYYRISIRLAYYKTPEESEIHSLIDEIKKCKLFNK